MAGAYVHTLAGAAGVAGAAGAWFIRTPTDRKSVYGFTLGVRAFEAWLYTFVSHKSH